MKHLSVQINTFFSNCSRNKPFCGGRVFEKIEMHTDSPVFGMWPVFRTRARRIDLWDFSFGFSCDLMLTKCHPFHLVGHGVCFSSTNTNLQQYCINFRICQRETRSSAAWNFIKLWFLTFLSNTSKHFLIPCWIIFLFSEIIARLILCYFV